LCPRSARLPGMVLSRLPRAGGRDARERRGPSTRCRVVHQLKRKGARMPANANDNPSARHRVVIVGGGFGGLFAAKFLRRAPVEVTLIDRTNHHVFQPLLYQLATRILSEGAVAPPLRHVLSRPHAV